MHFSTAVFALAAFASSALAHMEMIDPAPFRSKDNKLIDQSTVDFDMNSPLAKDGSNFPCKGFHSDFNLSPAGDPTATWAAGSPQKVTLDDSASHGGGSCQFSLSYDAGKTFRVIKSIEGDCPKGGKQSLDLDVPADAKSGKAIFAWTWFNNIGNREMYMNCAAVSITGTGTSTLDDRPEIFKANIGNGCNTVEGTDVKFPNPGPDVQVLSQAKLGPPTGECPDSSSSEPSPNESANPTKPARPTDSAEPTNSDTSPTDDSTSSAAPTDSAKPTDSTAPTDYDTSPTDDSASSDSSDSSADPTDSAAPTDSVTPTDSVASTDSAEPTKEPVSTRTSSVSAPTATPTSGVGPAYTVKQGDICINIAKQQSVELTALFKLNPAINKDCTNLKVGQVLTLRRRSRIMRDLN